MVRRQAPPSTPFGAGRPGFALAFAIVAFSTCRACGALFEETTAPCPVCGAAADRKPTAPSAPTSRDSYERFANTVGLVPNLLAKDNLFQGVFVAVTTALGAVVLGLIGGWPVGVLGGSVLGLMVGGLLSGGALMIRRLRRK